MTRIFFLENHSQVIGASKQGLLTQGVTIIAVTADALECLESLHIPHEPMCSSTSTEALMEVENQFNQSSFSVASDIEQGISPHPPKGLGLLTAHSYHLQHSVSSILTRAYLMRQVIRKYRPQEVFLFEGPVDDWFSADGYSRNPWCIVMQNLSAQENFRLIVLPSPSSLQKRLRLPYLPSLDIGARIIVSRFAKRLRAASPSTLAKDWNGLRLLFAGGANYDWAPIVHRAQTDIGISCFQLNGLLWNSHPWSFVFDPIIEQTKNRKRIRLNVSLLNEVAQKEMASEVLDRWELQNRLRHPLQILGINLFPALKQHLQRMLELSPMLMSYADRMAKEVLDQCKPHAVCFWHITDLSSKRLAYHAQQAHIPVFCYQHGGAYGTHNTSSQEGADFSFADYFLSYGSGIQYRPQPAFSARAALVPVGSARLQAFHPKPDFQPVPDNPIRILWLGCYSSSNTWGGSFLIEDTKRYLLQKQAFQLLDKNNSLLVTYRPPKVQVPYDGTARWLSRERLAHVSLDVFTPLMDLMQKSHLIIADTESNTVWNEAIVLKKPLLLFCDPRMTYLVPHYQVDLERVCRWCRTPDAFLKTLQEVSDHPLQFIENMDRSFYPTFASKYILGQNQDIPQTVLSLICETRHKKVSVA